MTQIKNTMCRISKCKWAASLLELTVRYFYRVSLKREKKHRSFNRDQEKTVHLEQAKRNAYTRPRTIYQKGYTKLYLHTATKLFE